MRQILPTPVDEVDPLALYPDDRRPPHPDRPWVMLNMIASIDGATAIEGRSGDLGGPADRGVFAAIRASCDWILVASGTANAERYRVPRPSREVRDRRVETGRAPVPGLAIVTARGSVDADLPAFTGRPADADAPLVITGTDAAPEALAGLDAEIVRVPRPTPEPMAVLAELGRRGARVVLAEGGPRWNGLLLAAGVIDEVCVSLGPILAGGASDRMVVGAPDGVAQAMRLERLLVQDDLLFARYVGGVNR